MIRLDPGEHLFYVAKIHWFLFVIQIISFVFTALFPLLLFLLAGSLPVGSFISSILSGAVPWFLFGYLVWLTLVWIAYFFAWTDYYLDAWIITNRRVIDVEQRGMFHRNIATLRLESVEDITIETVGILPTLLDIGSITIQTAGARNEFVFKNVYRPQKVKLAINTMVARRLQELVP